MNKKSGFTLAEVLVTVNSFIDAIYRSTRI